ncbi:MAG: VWA domain-containing protein [Planctomycetes bacterium]|nr:VWA domain-containing protein [Planctomycetota bacterium]
MKTKIGWMARTAVMAVALCGFQRAALADRVRLDVGMATTHLEANKKQIAYIKVGLTGFALERERRTPVNVAIVIDRSGSMSGDKITKAREAALMAVDRLNANDIVSVVAYNDTVSVLVPATKVSDKAAIRAGIERLEAFGSTALFAGVSKGADEVRKFLSRDCVNRVILVSDGQANVGPSSTSALAELGQSLAKERICVTTIGLGLNYNEDLMTQLARTSDGNSGFANSSDDLVRLMKSEFGDVLAVVAQELSVRIDCAEGIRPVRVLGREADITGNTVRVLVNQLNAGQEKYVLLEVEVPATRANQTREVAAVTASYANMMTRATDTLSATTSVRFTDSLAEAERSVNREVMIAVVTQTAVERNKLAVELRDKGRIDEAHAALTANAGYLKLNASKLDSAALGLYADRNVVDARNLDDANWGRQRKDMRYMQRSSEAQQSY